MTWDKSENCKCLEGKDLGDKAGFEVSNSAFTNCWASGKISVISEFVFFTSMGTIPLPPGSLALGGRNPLPTRKH